MSRSSRRRRREGPRDLKLRVMAEYGSSGIWVIGQVGPFRHAGIGYSTLRLPTSLSERFERWIESYWGRLDLPELRVAGVGPDAFDVEAFNREGRELAAALKAHLGPTGYVEFLPERKEGGLGEAEIIV